MDAATALDRLPTAYATALRLLDGGAGDNEIADELDIPRESVGPMLRVAVEKLVTLLDEEDNVPTVTGGDALGPAESNSGDAEAKQ